MNTSRFHVTLTDGNATLYLDHTPLLENITLSTAFTRGKACTLRPHTMENDGQKCKLLFTDNKYFSALELHFLLKDNSFSASIYAETGTWVWMEPYKLSPYASFTLSFTEAEKPLGLLSHNMNRDVWWMESRVSSSVTDVLPQTESALLSLQAGHLHLLPCITPDFRAELTQDGLVISTGAYGKQEFYGTVLGGTVSDAPETAYEENFRFLQAIGAFPYALRKERLFPKTMDGFGFCTWDAFKKGVTAEQIYAKLREFKEKNIPIYWMLIYDGWSQIASDKYLIDIYEDKTKFPEGLSGTIRRIKEEFGVKYVGVWHAYTVYWQGLLDGSPLYEKWKDACVRTAEGYLFLKPVYETAFRFFDEWHSYLKAQGVDFVKVDNQGSYSSKIECAFPATGGVAVMQRAIEDSAKKNFDGQILNCMGMNTESTLQSPTAPIMRMSDDYFPERLGSFPHHLTQNVYNSPFQGVVHHPDYDMWWSCHETAEVSAVLRAISGGPIYVSDALGITDPTYILPAIDENGRIFRPDRPANPTYDCFYTDCQAENKPFKVQNEAALGRVVAAFALGEEAVTGEIAITDLPAPDTAYLAESFFTGEQVILDKDHPISFTVEKNRAVLYNLYPIKNGEATLGDKAKYIGVATPASRTVKI